MKHLMLFLYLIPGEAQPMIESGWYAEQMQCEAHVQSLKDSAFEADIIVYTAKCELAPAP